MVRIALSAAVPLPPPAIRGTSLRVLVVEDSPADAVLVREMLRDGLEVDVELTHVVRLDEALEHLAGDGADCVLLDLSLPDAQGLEALAQVRLAAFDAPVVVLSGRNDEEIATAAVQEGAQDYLIKGQVDGRLLARSITYAIERKRVENELAHQALHDALTGLPNRALLLDRLGQALSRLPRRQGCLAVLFLDLDRFKVVNDSLGHGAGDRLLVDVAARLERVLRQGDTAARFGGDEFVLLCEDLDGVHQAIAVADRIADALQAPFTVDGEEVFVRTSIGISVAQRADARPEALIRDADAAMYRAKERGGSAYEVFDAAMRAAAVERLATQNALHRALEREELDLVFQPQFRLATGELCAVEALVRWQHPERGTVLPGEFIPAAEETGLIVELGAWVFDRACRQAAAWAAAGTPIPLSVNLSARQCAQPDLAAIFAWSLARHEVDPSTVCVEVTETTMLEDLEANVAVLAELKSVGVELSLDDFGTGWSSLRALQRFPVDEVKIDRSFVAGIDRNPEAASIVAAVISLAHALGLRCVAEGIETVAEADRLRTLGCDVGQGFFFARPESARAVTRRLG